MSKSKKQTNKLSPQDDQWNQWAALPEYVREKRILDTMGLLGQDVKEYPFLNKGEDIRLTFQQQDVFKQTSGWPIYPPRLLNYLAEHGYHNADSWDIRRILDALQSILDKKPDDLITLTVANKKYLVTKLHLRRMIKKNELTAYRQSASRNALIYISEKVVSGRWSPRP